MVVWFNLNIYAACSERNITKSVIKYCEEYAHCSSGCPESASEAARTTQPAKTTRSRARPPSSDRQLLLIICRGALSQRMNPWVLSFKPGHQHRSFSVPLGKIAVPPSS